MNDKIEEIRERFAGYGLNSGNAGKANEDRGYLLAEVERLREEVKHGHVAHKAACEGGDLLREEIVRLRMECFSLAANQCHAGYSDDRGNHRCCVVDAEKAKVERLREERDALRSAAREYLETLGGAMKSGKFQMGGSAEMAHFVRQAMQKLDSLVFDRDGPRPAGLEKLHEPLKRPS